MSPEILSHAMGEYLEKLKMQKQVAESFFFGRLEEGMEGLLQLPEDVKTRVDQLIWEIAGGEKLDPTEKEGRVRIAAAIIRSLEERMGFI